MTRAILAVIAVMGALVLLGRRFRVEPLAPAPIPDEWDSFVPMAAWRPAYVTAAEWRN